MSFTHRNKSGNKSKETKKTRKVERENIKVTKGPIDVGVMIGPRIIVCPALNG